MFKNFGNVIRKALANHNMTQKQAAKLLNISPQTLNHYINNYRMPSVDCFLQLIDLLDLNDALYSSYSFDYEDMDAFLLKTIPHLEGEQKRLLYFLVRYFDKSTSKTKKGTKRS